MQIHCFELDMYSGAILDITGIIVLFFQHCYLLIN